MQGPPKGGKEAGGGAALLSPPPYNDLDKGGTLRWGRQQCKPPPRKQSIRERHIKVEEAAVQGPPRQRGR